MDVLKRRTQQELIQSLLAEIAKSQNEVRCAQGDLNKANNRISFCIAVLNEILSRPKE